MIKLVLKLTVKKLRWQIYGLFINKQVYIKKKHNYLYKKIVSTGKCWINDSLIKVIIYLNSVLVRNDRKEGILNQIRNDKIKKWVVSRRYARFWFRHCFQ